MNKIRKTLVMATVVLATLFGFTSEAQAATKTMTVGQSCSLSLSVNGRYVKPTIVSAKESSSGVMSAVKYSSLSSGKYFAKVTARKAGTATIVARYNNKYYTYTFTVIAPAPVPRTPSCSGSGARYQIYCAKVANAVSYRIRVSIGSSSYSSSTVIGTSTNPKWAITNAKKGVKYYYWIDVKSASGVWYGKTSAWRCVIRK